MSVSVGSAAVLAALVALMAPRRAVIAQGAARAGSSEVIARITDRMDVLYYAHGTFYGFEDHVLYTSSDSGRSFRPTAILPKADRSLWSAVRNWVARQDVVRRFRRNLGPRSLVVLPTGTVIVFYDRIYRLAAGASEFEMIAGTESLPKPIDAPVGVSVGPSDTVFYGEYVVNRQPHPVRVVRGTDDGRHWEVVHTFPAGDIMHVHGVTWDPYRRQHWVTTGDSANAARLLFTRDGFQTMSVAGCCNPDWRAVALLVREHDLVWGSDDANDQPAIIRYDPATGDLQRVQELDNPSYHATTLADGRLAVATTYESFTAYARRKKPRAEASLWVSSDAMHWTRVLALPAPDASRRILFRQRPQITLPYGEPLPMLLATPLYTRDHHFQTLEISVSRSDSSTRR